LLKIEDTDDRLQIISGIVEIISKYQATTGQQSYIIYTDFPVSTRHLGIKEVGELAGAGYESYHAFGTPAL
jgi:hypothetical protein